MPSPPAVLLAAAHVILSRGGWCKGSRAQDERGVPCSPLGPRAVAWDLEGALQRAAYFILALPSGGNIHAALEYQTALAALAGHCPEAAPRSLLKGFGAASLLADYNDAPERALAEVLAAIEAALNSFTTDGGDPDPAREPA